MFRDLIGECSSNVCTPLPNVWCANYATFLGIWLLFFFWKSCCLAKWVFQSVSFQLSWYFGYIYCRFGAEEIWKCLVEIMSGVWLGSIARLNKTWKWPWGWFATWVGKMREWTEQLDIQKLTTPANHKISSLSFLALVTHPRPCILVSMAMGFLFFCLPPNQNICKLKSWFTCACKRSLEWWTTIGGWEKESKNNHADFMFSLHVQKFNYQVASVLSGVNYSLGH